MVPTNNGTACSCEPHYEFGEPEGDCIYPTCKDGRNPNCILCLTDNPLNCARCNPDLNLELRENRCVCPTGYVPNSLSVCAEPLCTTAVEHCRNCTAENPSGCYLCDDEKRRPSADATACECIDGYEEDENGECRRATCIFGSQAVPHCVICGVGADLLKCAECDDGYSLQGETCAKNKMSGGAIAGITIAVVVVLAGLAVLLYFLLRKKGGKVHKLESTEPSRNTSM